MKKLQHRLKYKTASVWDNFLETIFPPRCFVCDGLLETPDLRSGRRIHPSCRKKLYPVVQPYCYHCGSPLSDSSREYCKDCTGHRSFVEEGRSLFVYRGAVQKSMYRLKYANSRTYAKFLAEEAAQHLGAWMHRQQIDLIVPVPMFKKKQRYRGYNQAAVFARELERTTGVPCKTHAVSRIRDTRPQKELNGRDREKNVKNAFQVCDFVVKYKKILIVDDIYTTGATVEAVAAELKRNGAGQIFVLTACIGSDF